MNFSHATFEFGDPDFSFTRFDGPAKFNSSVFPGAAGFSFCKFVDDCSLECDVNGLLRVSSSHFSDDFSLSFARCGSFQAEQTVAEGLVLMDGTEIEEDFTWRNSELRGRAVIHKMKVGGTADFAGTTWHGRTDEKYVLSVGGWLILDGAEFRQPTNWRLKADVLTCVGATFRDSTIFSVVNADVLIDRAVFEGPARIIGEVSENSPRPSTLRREGSGPGSESRMVPVTLGGTEFEDSMAYARRPRMVSARRADLRQVVWTHLDAEGCHFFDAVGVDHLRWTNVSWGSAPPGRTRRRVVAEEARLRESGRWSWGWAERSTSPEWLQDPGLRPLETADLEPAEQPDPADIAEVYRQLRKGREDAKDAPGASDFYYGEMEMRRKGASFGEKALLTVYWAVSGYGLRASRSILALVLVVILAMYGMAAGGYCNPSDPYGDSGATCEQVVESGSPSAEEIFAGPNFTFVAGTAITFVGAPGAKLNALGRDIRLLLRIFGPVLVALSLIAIRNRVKR